MLIFHAPDFSNLVDVRYWERYEPRNAWLSRCSCSLWPTYQTMQQTPEIQPENDEDQRNQWLERGEGTRFISLRTKRLSKTYIVSCERIHPCLASRHCPSVQVALTRRIQIWTSIHDYRLNIILISEHSSRGEGGVLHWIITLFASKIIGSSLPSGSVTYYQAGKS